MNFYEREYHLLVFLVQQQALISFEVIFDTIDQVHIEKAPSLVHQREPRDILLTDQVIIIFEAQVFFVFRMDGLSPKIRLMRWSGLKEAFPINQDSAPDLFKLAYL